MVILVLILANIFAIFWGKYYTLTPILFYAGLAVICAISAWVSIEWQTKNLIVIAVSATLVSFIDEYAHTSVGTLTYFDGYVPSLLTVFGWSIFMIFLVGVTRFIFNVRWVQVENHKKLRTLPVVISLALIITSIIVQGYLNIFNWVIILVYLLLFAASFYYTSVHQLKLNLLMMVISLAFGLSMEYVGGMEDLWTFRFHDPVSFLILFTWPLRLYAVNAVCAVAGVDFFSFPKKPVLEPTSEADKNKSLIVVADTHFGLRKEAQVCDPKAFSDFLNWIKHLEGGGEEQVIPLGIWGYEQGKSLALKPPEKIIFLGDILELWDASVKSIDASTRYLIQLLPDLKCEKVYVLGNHDHDLLDITGDYPLGASNVNITDKEVRITKGTEEYLFVHGQQFDELFALPSWQFMSPIRNAALAFGAYTWIFVVLFAADIVFESVAGFRGVADIVLSVLLGAISIPFLMIEFGRKIWNRLKTTKHKPMQAEKNVEAWWNKFSANMERNKSLNIVFGHTHIIDFWMKAYGNSLLTVWNIPSWVKDSSKTRNVNMEQVFRHAFLYIHDEGCEFVGWDTSKKRPFLIPKEIIMEKRENWDLTKSQALYEIDECLREIGWPEELISKWMQFNPL